MLRFGCGFLFGLICWCFDLWLDVGVLFVLLVVDFIGWLVCIGLLFYYYFAWDYCWVK